MIYSFDGAEAREYGVQAAVILSNLRFWIAKNKANGKHYYDGRTWSYNSIKAWGKLYPFFSERQIRYALKKLEDKGVILTGNYNKNAYDRTKWYAITDESTCENTQNHLTKLSNRRDENVKPIPDSLPDRKPDTPQTPQDSRISPVDKNCQEILAYLNKQAGRNFRKVTKELRARIKNKELTVRQCRMIIDWKLHEWSQKPDMANNINPTTLFRPSNYDRYREEAERWNAQGRPKNGKPQNKTSYHSQEYLQQHSH